MLYSRRIEIQRWHRVSRRCRLPLSVVASFVAMFFWGSLSLKLLACSRPPARTKASTVVRVQLIDAQTKQPIGGRLLLIGKDGPLRIGTIDLYGKRQAKTACQLGPGALGTWDGIIVADGTAEMPIGADGCAPTPAIPFGEYEVWAWRGIEYDKWQGTWTLAPGQGTVEHTIALQRAWQPSGTLAADLHVHAFASNDSGVPNPQRVLAQAAAGIDVIALSDHNRNGDLDREIEELGLTDKMASIASNELSSNALHIGVYPVQVDPAAPAGGAPPDTQTHHATIAQLLSLANRLPGRPIVQVNHPRFRVASMFDTAAWNGVSWPPPFPLNFDAFEVLNGHTAFNAPDDRRLDESARDYYTFVDHGFLPAPLGNSDTHHLNGVHDALCRNYVYTTRAPGAAFDEAGFVAALRKRRVVATSGPWLDVEVAPTAEVASGAGPGQFVTAANGAVVVRITVRQANFMQVDRLRIWRGGPNGPELFDERNLTGRAPQLEVVVPVGGVDNWLGVDVSGETPLPVELTGTYQLEKMRPGAVPYAIISAILVDADGNGRWQRGLANLDAAN